MAAEINFLVTDHPLIHGMNDSFIQELSQAEFQLLCSIRGGTALMIQSTGNWITKKWYGVASWCANRAQIWKNKLASRVADCKNPAATFWKPTCIPEAELEEYLLSTASPVSALESRPIPLSIILLIALVVHGPLLLMELPQNSYDTNFHEFFASHYAHHWFDPWNPNWYAGFSQTTYPPLPQQWVALFSHVMSLNLAYML